MSAENSNRSSTDAPRASRTARLLVYLAFAAVAIVALDVPLYNRAEPAAFGIPFFYWFQVAWIGVTACATFVAYRLKV